MTRSRPLLAALVIALAATGAAEAGTDPATDPAPTRLAVDLTGYDDQTTVVAPADLSAPELAEGVGPGSHLLISFPDGSLAGCTANFVWESGGTRYLGAAGHCFLDAEETSTHGPDADADVSDVTVRACISECTNGGYSGFVIQGSTVELGAVAYARQSRDGTDVGYDFGVVAIPDSVPVRTHMPVFDGPTRADGESIVGEAICHYGSGVAFGEVYPTMGRAGAGLFEFEGAFYFEGAASPGDSGSAVQTCVTSAADGLAGDGAVGALTHITNIGIAGTTVERAVELAEEAKLKLTLVLAGSTTTDTGGGDDSGNGNGDGGKGGPPPGKGPNR